MYDAQVMSETSKFHRATQRTYFKFGIKFRYTPTCCLTLNRKRSNHNGFYYSFSKFASDVQKDTVAFWHVIHKSGPALGRFDVTQPSAYAGPALMGDSRISDF
jgi:hypothetical protein